MQNYLLKNVSSQFHSYISLYKLSPEIGTCNKLQVHSPPLTEQKEVLGSLHRRRLISSCYSRESTLSTFFETIPGSQIASAITAFRHLLLFLTGNSFSVLPANVRSFLFSHIFCFGEFQDRLWKLPPESCYLLRETNPLPRAFPEFQNSLDFLYYLCSLIKLDKDTVEGKYPSRKTCSRNVGAKRRHIGESLFRIHCLSKPPIS